MQSTSNTAVATAIRPKIGRPPALPPKLVIVSESAARRSLRGLIIALVAALTLTLLAAVLSPLFKRPAPPIPPLVENTPHLAAPAMTGALMPIQPAEPSVSYTQQPPHRNAAIDNHDRRRLLSILSKD